jgi:hypothetical protein
MLRSPPKPQAKAGVSKYGLQLRSSPSFETRASALLRMRVE